MKVNKIRRSFKAWHAVNLPIGPEESHSHHWNLEVSFTSAEVFRIIKSIDQLVEKLDQINLNDIDQLMPFAASAESVARMIFQRLSESVGAEDKILKVDIEEEPGCWATYFEELKQ